MAKKSNSQNISGTKLSNKSKFTSPVKPDNSDEVARVLEHVSSPFRWELLEVPPVISPPGK
jgi:hypothetical protein